jgi:hypothetical protein
MEHKSVITGVSCVPGTDFRYQRARRKFSAGVLHCQLMGVGLCYELISSAERNEREREREREKQAKKHAGEASLLPQRLSCY